MRDCDYKNRMKFVGNYGNNECYIELKSVTNLDEGTWKCTLESYVFGSAHGTEKTASLKLKLLNDKNRIMSNNTENTPSKIKDDSNNNELLNDKNQIMSNNTENTPNKIKEDSNNNAGKPVTSMLMLLPPILFKIFEL